MSWTVPVIKLSGNAEALVYYLGSKRRMADLVVCAARDLAGEGATAIDLFSGTGSTSVALACSFAVTSVDVQEYSRVMCSALIEEGSPIVDDRVFLDRWASFKEGLLCRYGRLVSYEQGILGSPDENAGELSSIIEHGCLLAMDGMASPELSGLMRESLVIPLPDGLTDTIVCYYGGTYFSYLQAVELSAACSAARTFDGWQRDRYLASVICAASHCGSTVGGQFAQPLRTVDPRGLVKTKTIRKATACRAKSVSRATMSALEEIDALRKPGPHNAAIRAECREWLREQKPRADVIYADPPYSRYHYSRYYHVLETIARGDSPDITPNPATGRPSRGMYRAGRYQSPFSTRGGASGAFEELFVGCSASAPALVLSYSPYPSDRPSTPRMITIDDLTALAKQSYRHVDVVKVDDITHSKLTKKESFLETSETAELMILCRN